jgi:hypothetical protein
MESWYRKSASCAFCVDQLRGRGMESGQGLRPDRGRELCLEERVQEILILCVLRGPTFGKGPGRVPWTGPGAAGRQGRGKLERGNRILCVLSGPTFGKGPRRVPWTGPGAAGRQGRGKLEREIRILRVLRGHARTPGKREAVSGRDAATGQAAAGTVASDWWFGSGAPRTR